MEFLQVLAELFRIFVDLIPRVAIRPKTNQWLVIDSGLFGVLSIRWPRPYWPVTCHIEYWPMTEEPCDADIQSVTTRDNRSVSVNCACRYQIIDPVVLRSHWSYEQYEANIVMTVRGAIEQAYANREWDDIVASGHACIQEDVNKQLADYGASLPYFCVEERLEAPGVRVLGVCL